MPEFALFHYHFIFSLTAIAMGFFAATEENIDLFHET